MKQRWPFLVRSPKLRSTISPWCHERFHVLVSTKEHGAGRSIVSVSIPDPLSTTKEIGVHKVYDVKCWLHSLKWTLIVIIQNNPNSVYCTPAKSLPRPFHIEARTHLWNSVSVPVTSPLRSIYTADILQLFKNVYTFMHWSFPEEELRVIQNNPNSVYSSIAAWNNEMINSRRIGPLQIESIQPC